MTRVVVLMQENRTPDYYFPTLAAWGADIRRGGALLADPPIQDPQHDRNAWVHYKMGDYAPQTCRSTMTSCCPSIVGSPKCSRFATIISGSERIRRSYVAEFGGYD